MQPVLMLYLPLAHVVHAPWPTIAVYWPSGHSTHVRSSVALPPSLSSVPAAHTVLAVQLVRLSPLR